jgi:hypothetical protein
LAIQIIVEQFGRHKNIPSITLPTDKFGEAIRALEKVCFDHGVSPDRVAFRWNPDGDDRSYMILLPSNNIIGVFRILDVVARV